MIVRVAEVELAPVTAESVAVTAEATVVVEIVKFAVVAPAATVTLPGTRAAALFEDKFTMAPFEGAGVFSVTVPTADAPPPTEFGAIVN